MKEEILSLLNDVFPAIDFCSSDRLVDDGILSSLSFSDATSIDAITALVEKRMK